MTAEIAIGTLRKKIQRQLRVSVRTPPISGPIALPSPAEPRMIPPARPARSSGRIAKVMPRIAGHISAPPIPISTRAPISQVSVCAAPPRADIAAKIAAPRKKARRRPNMSARRPPVTIITPKVSA